MRYPLYLLGVLAAGLHLPGGAAAQQPAPASVDVTVPADARVTFDGHLTRKTGTRRSFTTPPLPPGRRYGYDLRVEVTRGGRVVGRTIQVVVRAGQTTRVDLARLTTPERSPAAPRTSWPLTYRGDGGTVTIYTPQVEKWQHSRLEARAPVAVQSRPDAPPTYGVIWLSARTAVDKETSRVRVDEFELTRGSFPSAPNRTARYLDLLREGLPVEATIALDHLHANLAATRVASQRKAVKVKNDPPTVLLSTRPGVLVLIDGKPSLGKLAGGLHRVRNTRALLLRDPEADRYYLRVADRWMSASKLDGPWSVPAAPPDALAAVLKVAQADPAVELLDPSEEEDSLARGIPPVVHVRTTPTELIVTRGKPEFEPVEGTKLRWLNNSPRQVLLDTAQQRYYALLSGRWFRSRSLEGPWEFVRADRLPADFAKVPETHPRGDVLCSVAGTPQAEEALIAHSLPQTAIIQRSEAKLSPTYDGSPRFEPIAGTSLKYAVNTPTPVVQTGPSSYYAIENGVWFNADDPEGPWDVTPAVPDDIYDIPADSALYYVTGAYVYGATPEVVYVGYTPVYLNTFVCPEQVVVFGTGYPSQPWLGDSWFGRPWTYGWGSNFAWTPRGWNYRFAAARPWWGPIGWNAGWGGTWRPGWNRGWGGPYANARLGAINFGNFNVYNRWNNRARVAQGFTSAPGGTTLGRGIFNLTGPGGTSLDFGGTLGGWAPFGGLGSSPSLGTGGGGFAPGRLGTFGGGMPRTFTSPLIQPGGAISGPVGGAARPAAPRVTGGARPASGVRPAGGARPAGGVRPGVPR